MVKTRKLSVLSTEISVVTGSNNDDFICLTDMVKASDDESRAADIIKNWIRNRATIEFLGAWEMMYNPNFKVVKFDHFRKSAGLPTFTMSVTNWVEDTNAIGIYSKSGRYGGTYAHKDIAFEFGAAISPTFKLYLILSFKFPRNSLMNWGVPSLLHLKARPAFLLRLDCLPMPFVSLPFFLWQIFISRCRMTPVLLSRCP